MYDQESGPVVSSVLWRLSIAVVLLAVPTMAALLACKLVEQWHKPFGGWVGWAVWLAGILSFAAWVAKQLRDDDVTLAEFLTTAEPYEEGSKLPGIVIGLVLAAGGVLVCAAAEANAGQGATTIGEQWVLGGFLIMLGSGASGLCLSGLMARRHWNRRFAELDRRIQDRPESPDRHVARGSVLLKRHETRRAVNDFSEAIRLDPDHLEARLQRARAYFYLDRFEEALADLNRVIQLDPRRADAYWLRGTVHEDNQQSELAEADFARAEELE